MDMEVIKSIPIDLQNFILVALMSLILGLEQRRHHLNENVDFLFGTDRTFALVGILGFILYVIDKSTMLPFLLGGGGLLFLLGIAYYFKIKIQNKFGLTSVIIAMITYSLAPLIYLQPSWLVMLVIVTVLIIVEIKEDLFEFTRKFGRDEFTILAKFIIIAGVILPLLPHEPISKSINISPYQFWLTIVAISGISYSSYILKKFIFPNSGIMLTAILGGLYSSTATTVILAKKSKNKNASTKTAAGIISATGVMYFRIFILAWIFNRQVAYELVLPFLLLIIASAVISFIFLKNSKSSEEKFKVEPDKNPLEFRTALIFGLLFSLFAVLTNYVVSNFGNEGINILSLIVGVTDIDPYILNLFQDISASISIATVVSATIIATASNNAVKMIYALMLGGTSIKKQAIIGFSIIIALSFIIVLF
ncbi:hypothetical protein MNBD_IGNAVI01-2622 [hydrothermal vent metagenome]|uniref:DUF4010 domain-containing protein n=1 Tax=hydrothermal vent metagenome TaxID=652676 RepID=A0A3B1CJT6_9ZZZZ